MKENKGITSHKKGKLSPFFIDRIGEIHINKQGCRFEIVECLNSKKLTLKFLDKYEYTLYNRNYTDVLKGEVKNPYYPSVYNVGYLGVGKYSNKSHPKIYERWKKMIHRCYDEKSLTSTPCYRGVTVCEEWHNFQNFEEWYEENFKPYMQDWQLDKDILQNGTKVYNPETCCFIPQDANKFLVKPSKRKDKLPLGIRLVGKTYEASMSKYGKKVNLGSSTIVEKAFELYKDAKEKYAKEIAENYKGIVDDRVYQVLVNFKINITD
jgi:hypothetical protein